MNDRLRHRVALAIALALVLTLWIVLWAWSSPGPSTVVDAAPREHASNAAPMPGPEVTERSDAVGSERQRVDDPLLERSGPSFEFDIEVATGVCNVQEFLVWIGLETTSTNCLSLSTDAEGRAHFRFVGRRPTATLVVDRGLLRRVQVAAGARQRIQLGERWHPPLVLPSVDEPDLPPPPGWLPEHAQFRATDPLAAFATGAEPADAPDGWSRTAVSTGSSMAPGTAYTLEVLVVDQHGGAVDGALVELESAGQTFSERARAGRFVFPGLPPGPHRLTARHERIGASSAAVDVGGAMQPVLLKLTEDGCVFGRVLATDGAPLARRGLLWVGDDGEWRDDVASLNDGEFLVSGLRVRQGSLWVLNGDRSSRVAGLPVVGARVEDDGRNVVLRFDPASPTGSLRVTTPAEFWGNLPVAVRVWHLDSGIGVHARPAAESTRHGVAGLAAGFYRVEVIAAGGLVVDAGRHWVDGATRTDVGPVLPAFGRLLCAAAVDVLPADGKREFLLYRLQDDVDVFVNLPAPLPGELRLAAGDYLLCWRDGAQRLRRETFAIRNGEITRLQLQH
jgi:hypothetical protein